VISPFPSTGADITREGRDQESEMNILAGMKVTNKEGFPGVIVSPGDSSRPGDSSKVVSLSSGEMREWPISSYTVDEKQDISSVFVVNQKALKVSTIMWGVLLGNMLTGIVGFVAYAMVARV
jgi:hypothetical protein